MGDWIYYISYMKLSDIAQRVRYAEEIHTSKTLNDLLQRTLTSRSQKIADYLVKQEQRFFNTLIIGVYDGSPSWYALSVNKNQRFDPSDIPEDLEGAIGYLSLTGREKLFAIDGQHRVAGIHRAIKRNASIGDDEVSVIFLSAKKDPESMKRTRRLFSTLNRYAKAVSKRDIIALDEDDTVAIIIRQLLDEYPLFYDERINTRVIGKSIPSNDKASITTLVALYDAVNIYLPDSNDSKWKAFLSVRPNENIIHEYYQKTVELLDCLQRHFPELRHVSKDHTQTIKYRHSEGGHLLFRPVGLLMIAHVIKLCVQHGFTLNEAVRRISKVNLDLSANPWAGLLWESIKKRMITRKENQQVAIVLLFYIIGGDLAHIRTNPTKLLEQYGSAINWDEEDLGSLKLPRRLRFRQQGRGENG
jgi:DNA sulfur modification protein DndB